MNLPLHLMCFTTKVFKVLMTVMFVLSLHHALASDLQITNTMFDGNPRDERNPTLTAWITVSWKNAWRNEKNYDAAWIFFKLNAKQEAWSKVHGFVKKTGHTFIHNYQNNGINPSFFVPEDGMGIMIFPDRKHRGDVSWRIKVELDMSKITGISDDLMYVSTQGIEMVYIPQASFYAGEADTSAQRHAAAFYEYGSNDYYKVNAESAITVDTLKGNLYYENSNEPNYKGDMKGPVPAAFPKGYDAFYIMKYELTEGIYCSFLNAIGNYYSHPRANFGGKNYNKERGSIYLEDGKYKTKSINRPASFLSWDDDCAFADWSGLRPMTELEYEKACRGPMKPAVANSFPWGNASNEKLSRYFNDAGDLVLEQPYSEGDLSDSNLEIFGASYYWVMDLNKSLWERCVSLGNEKGRLYQGTHGDGKLMGYKGTATNEDWPNWYDGKGGISYRGGGYYLWNMVGAPRGETGHRPYGAWGDGPQDIAYGFRAVRSAR